MQTQRIAQVITSIPLLFASFWALRFAYADFLFRSGTPENIRRAVELAPLNPEYQARAGNLRRAVELNPYFSSAWIEIGIAAESAGDIAESERCLLQAARVDQTFDPRWALANFYFRRDNRDEFWKWLRLAAERSYGDRTALFRLAARMSPDPAEMQRRALPTERTILTAWLTYLMEDRKLDAIPGAASILIPMGGAESVPILLRGCDELLKAERTQGAISIWNGMIEHRLLPYKPLDPSAGMMLTNAGLTTKPTGAGFDWRLLWRGGVDSRWVPSREIRISLDGKQLEQTDLLEQMIPVLPEKAYSFRFRYRTDGFAAKPGLYWRVLDQATSPPLAPASDWKEQVFQFQTSRHSTLVRLQLAYQREPGTVRREGTIVFDGSFNLSPTR